jgi:hypothetical protein
MDLKQISTLGTMFFMLFAIPAIAFADQHSMSPTTDVGNSIPSIYYMALDDTSYDPTESSTTKVTLTLRVKDPNGIGDLNDASVKAEVDDAKPFSSAVAKYTNTTCTKTSDISGTQREYKCSWDMDYWDTALEYSTKVTAGDQAGTVFNNTATNAPAYNYTTLIATDIDSTAVSFGTVTIGSTNNPASENPSAVSNTGNADLYINVTGASLTGSGYTYAVGNFSISLDGVPTVEQYLTTSSVKITGASIAKGTDGTPSPTENLYWFADTPNGVRPVSYSGTWYLTQYEQ